MLIVKSSEKGDARTYSAFAEQLYSAAPVPHNDAHALAIAVELDDFENVEGLLLAKL